MKIESSPNYTKRRIIAGTVAAIGSAAIISGVVKGVEAYNDHETRDRIAQNAEVIRSARGSEDFTGSLILRNGVNFRTSPEFKNGDNSTGEQSNIVSTVKKHQSVLVHHAIRLEDGWVAFDKPNTDKHDVDDHVMADELVYVNVAALESKSPQTITMPERQHDSYIDLEGQPVFFRGGKLPEVATCDVINSNFVSEKPVIE